MSKFKAWKSKAASSPFVFGVVSRLMAGWIRFVFWTSKVEKEGWKEFESAISNNQSVIICCWHQRILLLPYMMPGYENRCNGVTAHKRPGRFFGQMLKRFGFKTTPMPRGTTGTAQMRSLLRELSKGTSICISPDGSSGPARICKPTPIQWARVGRVPIFTFTFSPKRFLKMPTWDSMLIPGPFNRMKLVWRRWDVEVPKEIADLDALCLQLQEFMNDACEEVDLHIGHNGPVL